MNVCLSMRLMNVFARQRFSSIESLLFEAASGRMLQSVASGTKSFECSSVDFLRRFSKKCHFFEKWYFHKIPTSHISRPAPTDFRLWLGGSPTGTSIVRRSHLPLPTSCLLEIWFKGTLYVQEVRVGNYGFDVGRFIGRMLHEPRVYCWLSNGRRRLFSLQQRVLTCWCRLRSTRCTTLPR